MSSQRHAGRRQKQQGLLFWQLLFQPLNDLWPFVGSLKRQKRKGGLQTKLSFTGRSSTTAVWRKSWSVREEYLFWQCDDSWAWNHLAHGTFSLWISLLRDEILILMASSSSSGTCGMEMGSVSSAAWKVRSDSGMYHLQSYCWLFLGTKRQTRESEGWGGIIWYNLISRRKYTAI